MQYCFSYLNLKEKLFKELWSVYRKLNKKHLNTIGHLRQQLINRAGKNKNFKIIIYIYLYI